MQPGRGSSGVELFVSNEVGRRFESCPWLSHARVCNLCPVARRSVLAHAFYGGAVEVFTAMQLSIRTRILRAFTVASVVALAATLGAGLALAIPDRPEIPIGVLLLCMLACAAVTLHRALWPVESREDTPS